MDGARVAVPTGAVGGVRIGGDGEGGGPGDGGDVAGINEVAEGEMGLLRGGERDGDGGVEETGVRVGGFEAGLADLVGGGVGVVVRCGGDSCRVGWTRWLGGIRRRRGWGISASETEAESIGRMVAMEPRVTGKGERAAVWVSGPARLAGVWPGKGEVAARAKDSTESTKRFRTAKSLSTLLIGGNGEAGKNTSGVLRVAFGVFTSVAECA